MPIDHLAAELREFAAERDWNQFHSPKNLVLALAGEVGELASLFQWLTPEESVHVMDDQVGAMRVREEVADVFGYLVRLADVLGIDLEAALSDKIRTNAEKYPVSLSRGVATKYSDLPS